jgi:5-methyltetrahydropteroyltriglutamate--homocysteine methyltransferase
MKRSTDRILTTHVGSLIRPPDLMSHVAAMLSGKDYDRDAYARTLTGAVADVVKRQAECGVDVVSDGEFGKSS